MAYIILEKIEASQHIESIVSATDLKNGQFVTLGKLAVLDNGGEAHQVTEMTTNDTDIVLHASVPLIYEDGKNEMDFVLKAGKLGRGYRIKDGNQVAFSKDLVEGVAKADVLVVPQGKGVKVVSAKPEKGLYGKIVEVFADVNAGEMFSVKFIK